MKHCKHGFQPLHQVDDFIDGENIAQWSTYPVVIIILIMFPGDPTVFLKGLKGKPVINFDGNDLLWTSQDFD